MYSSSSSALPVSYFGLPYSREDPVFCDSEGRPPSKSGWADTFQDIAAALGLPIVLQNGARAYTGHSARATGAQFLATRGIELWRIQIFGRWGSDIILRYLREAPLAHMTELAIESGHGEAIARVRGELEALLAKAKPILAIPEEAWREVEPSSILDQKIREFSKKTQDVSVDEFKDYFWQLFRMASNTNNLEMCKNLLRAVPNALKDEKDVHFQSLEPSGKSPLHFSVADHFHQLGQWLFETYPREMKSHCLMQDHHGRIPLDYMEPRKALQPHQEGSAFYPVLLFETFQEWCTEMGPYTDDRHSFEDKERMKRIGADLLKRILEWGMRHVDVACTKRHTVLHLLAVHGVEEQEVLGLQRGSPAGSDTAHETGTLLEILLRQKEFDADIRDATSESKAPMELATEQRHAKATKLFFEAMLSEMHEIKDDHQKQDRFKGLKTILEDSLIQLHARRDGHPVERSKDVKQICCSCAQPERLPGRLKVQDDLRNFVEMKLQVQGYEATLLHYACGADPLIDAARLQHDSGASLARRLLEQRAANSQDSLRKTPLNWAVTKHLPSIAWDICEFGIENDVADVLDDIEHHLASLPEEYALFRVSMDSAKAVPAGFGSLVLWIEFETGARTYLDGCVSPSPEPGKTVLEFRPSNMVAPFQFQLDSDGVQLDKVPGRLSFTLEGLLLGQKDHETGFVIEEQWVTLFPNLPLKEWCQTTKTQQRLEFMNYHSKRDGFTIWHLACKYRNLRLSKILKAHNATYGFCLECEKTPLDCAAATDCEVIMEDADSELEDGLLTGAKVAGVADSKRQELAKLLLFHDYVRKASRHQMSPKKIARKYFLYFGIEPAVLVAMRDVDGKVLLHYAAYFGLFKDVEWLLEKGAQVDVYDQMSIQDFRFTIMDPPKQELWSQLQKAYALTEIPFPEFCCQKAEREPFNAVMASPTEDVYWLRQEDIPEFATLRVCFQRPERFDGFRWPAKGEDGMRHEESGEPGAVDVKLCKWMMEARACERLRYRAQWLTVNFGHQGVLVDVDDFQSGKYISMHVHRTPLDHALLGAMDNAETMYNVRDTADESISGISDIRLPPHARICKILIEQALLCEKQEGRTLLAETFASFCRPCHVARGLSKYIVDILVQEPGASAEKTTLLHVAAKHGLRDVCNQLLKYRCTFKEVSMQTPLDVASDEGTYHLLILPAFVSICQKIHTRALPNEDEEAIAARVEQVDQEATAWLTNMESRALSLQKIVRISNPQQGKYTMVDYAAMYGMKRVLAHVIDGLADIEDETKITCPAEIIGIEMPRYGERNQVIYDLRSLFTAADDRWTSLNLKQKLKDMKEAFKGKTREELVEALKRELHEHIHYVASLDTEEAIEFFDVALEAKAEWRKKKDATTGDTALHMAARSDNIDIVKLLCEKYKVNKEDKNMNQERPIHSAARNHSYKTMKYLLEGGVQPLPPNFKKEHPMHLLAKTLSLRSPGQRAPDPEEFQEVMSILMAKVAESNSWMNLTKRDADGKSALEYLVSSCGHTYAGPVVEKLVHVLPAAVLESSCFFAALDNPTGPSRFLKALLKNTADRKILTKLLDQDQDENGLNVVQICALKGDMDSLREILNALAAPDLLRQALIPEEIEETKLNASMCDQTPPLILALRHGKEDVAKRLASRMLGLDENHRARAKWEDECHNSQLKQDLISIFNQAGQTFFQLIRSGEVGAVRNLLIAQPALVESADAAGNTALHVAVQTSFKHQKEIVQLLLSHGAVLSEGGQNQETPLHLLCRRSAAQMYQSGMDWPPERKWEECKGWSPAKDMLQDSEDGAKDELFTLTKITELILREVVSRCGEDNARAVTDILSIQAREGNKTPFDLVSTCLDAAAFLSDHPLRKYLKQAWLKPLLALTETISLPGTRKLSLLGLAVLLRANEATIRLQHDDPLEGPADETPFTYALMLQQFDLVRKMLNRIEEQRLHDRLEEVMMQPHTEGLLFTPQANSEQIPSQIFEVLPSQNVVRLLTRSPGILTRCLQTGNDTLLENMRSKICSLQDRDGAALTLHSAIETAVKEVGEETSQQLLQLRDATGMRCLGEMDADSGLQDDEVNVEEQVDILGRRLTLLLLLPTLLCASPDHVGEPCLQACGNFTGWCAWCGAGKACCRPGYGPEECSTAPPNAGSESHQCIVPSKQALESLAVVSFTFDLQGLFYAAVQAKDSLKQDLILRSKEIANKIMLNTSQPHQMAMAFSRGSRGFARVQMTIMIPHGGEAVVSFAENRLCSMPSVAKFNADAQNLDGVKFGEEGGTVEIMITNRKVNDGKDCPTDPASMSLRRRHMQGQAQVWLPWLATGLFGGSCLTCALLSLCNDHCKQKPVRGSARRHPAEGKAQVSWKDSFQEEGTFMPLRGFMAPQESSAFSSSLGSAQFSSGTYQQGSVASWPTATYK
ncbi:Ank3 [Symbiodinium microadriaticum]|nr:Ank3 [Symbiodinium microadriaticum]